MATKNYIENVAIVGGAGQVGSYFVDELLKTGKHKVTVITREGGSSTFQDGVHVAKVNYDDQASLVKALKGQDFFVITMSNHAPQESQLKLIDAAGEAGVPYIMPNWYGMDYSSKKLGEDIRRVPQFQKITSHIESAGKSAWISYCCGFWYEFSLCLKGRFRYGFEVGNREVTFFDDGNTEINTSTFLQTGRGLAKLLSLKISPEGPDDKSPTLSQFHNKAFYVSSFHISQRDMFESLKRVTGTTDKDWKITFQPSAERYEEGTKKMEAGSIDGYVQQLYSRVLYPTGEASFNSKINNEVLGLPVEDLDEATKRGIEMYKETW